MTSVECDRCGCAPPDGVLDCLVLYHQDNDVATEGGRGLRREREDEVNAVRPDIADSYGPINQARWTQKMRTGGLLWAFQATIFSVTHDMEERRGGGGRRPLFMPLSG